MIAGWTSSCACLRYCLGRGLPAFVGLVRELTVLGQLMLTVLVWLETMREVHG